MENISRDLKEFTKDKPSLQNFLNFVIKNKVYEPQLYLVDTKDFDKNNILLKASIHFLNSQLETLIPLLKSEVFAYENKNKLTFPQRFFAERFKEPSSFAAIEYMYKQNKAAFCVQNEEFNPFYLLESIGAQYYGVNNPKPEHIKKVEKLLWDMSSSFPHKVGEYNFYKPFIVRHGLEPFTQIDFSKKPEKLIELFVNFHAHKDIVYSQEEVNTENWQPKVKSNWSENPKYLKDRAILDSLLLENLPKMPKSIASIKTNLVSALIYMGADREKLIGAFLELIDKNPQVVASFAMDKLDKKDTLLHKIVYAQRGYFKRGVENQDAYEIQFFNFVMENCNHLNTKNEQGFDPFELAKSLQLEGTAQVLYAFIEKKIMTSTLKNALETPNEEDASSAYSAPKKKISKI